MTDPRYTKLAKLLVEYSTDLKKGDRILLDMIDVPDEMTIELIRAARARDAVPFVETRHTRVGREILRGIDENRMADALVNDTPILHVVERKDREHGDTTDEKRGGDAEENRVPEPRAP